MLLNNVPEETINPNEHEMEFVIATSYNREDDVSQPNLNLIHVVQSVTEYASCLKSPSNIHVEFPSNLYVS